MTTEDDVQRDEEYQPLSLTAPCDIRMAVTKVTVPGAGPAVNLLVQHPTGDSVFTIPQEYAVALGKELIEQGSGLHVASGPLQGPLSNGN